MDMQRVAKQFWAKMTHRYNTTVIEKDQDIKMQAVSWALDLMGIVDRKKFMNNFTTTIGHDIYTPWEIGDGDDEECFSQIVVCVHEHQHVLQEEKEEFLFSFKYLSDSAYRAAYEAEAYRATMEMYWLKDGTLLDPAFLAGKLENYACSQEDIEFARKHLESAKMVVEQGGIALEPTKVAMEILQDIAPNLLQNAW